MHDSSSSFILTVLFAIHNRGHRVSGVARRWRRLTAAITDPYRPELHYMRGPGPKWREKHAHNGTP
jgi:hypothetical protein